MTKKKTTRRALFSSAISLLLCVCMMLGTTFAWFTDEVTSENNIIQSGTLDAKMSWKEVDGTEWTDASKGAIFNYQHWEPGYVDIKYVKIENAGTLAFKFRLNIIPNDFSKKEYDLADVIDVYMLPGDTDTTERIDLTQYEAYKVGTLSDLITDADGAAYGVMLPAEGKGASNETIEGAIIGEATYCIALKMQETAGNEYQGLSVGEGFRVQLLATQYTWEEDSFDNNYDGYAAYDPWGGDIASDEELASITDTENKTVTISTAAQLAAFAASVNSGNNYDDYKVVLTKSINLNNMPWTPIGTGGAGFYGDFDGQGNTVYNIKVENEAYAGLFGYVHTGSVSNVNVENVDIKTSHYAGAIVGQGYVKIYNCHAKNVNIVNTVANDDNGDKTGGIIGQNCEGATMSVTKCSVTNATLQGYRDIGGIIGMAHNNNVVTGNTATNVNIIVDTSNNYNEIEYLTAYNAGEIIGRYGSNVSASGNEYSNVTIRYTVSAAGTAPVDTTGATTVDAQVKTDENNASNVATFNIPYAALEENVTEVTVSVVETELDADVTVDSDQSATTYEVTVTGIKEDNTELIKVQLKIGTGLTNVKVYHKGTEVTPVVYHSDTGWVIFETTSFSPYTVVYDTVAVEEETPVIPDPNPETGLPDGIPVAVVTDADQYENTEIVWSAFAGIPAYDANQQLESAYIFAAPHDSKTVTDCIYKDWYCDYYVMLDRDLGESSIFLAGNYGDYGWVGFDNGDLTLEANTEIPLLGSVTELPWTYEDVVCFVEEFTCGVAHLNDSLDGATFTVMLRLTNPDDATEFYNVNTVTYTFGETAESN